jgi:hypothetical protein
VLVWPSRAEVDRAVRSWARRAAAARPQLEALGYFGSYARGDWGVGSDLDLIAIVSTTGARFERRAIDWDTTGLPVPADLLVYSREEWDRLRAAETRFSRMLAREVVWVCP